MVEGWIISQHEVFVDGQIKPVTNIGHDFGLLHGVDAQLALEVLVEFNEVSRVSRVVDHNLNHGRNH